MENKEYVAAERKKSKQTLRDDLAGHAMQGFLASRDSNRRLTDGEVVFLVEDSWKLAAAMIKGRP